MNAPTLFWEDFTVGEVHEMGKHTFTTEEIIDFAKQFDPQPIHTDPEAARASYFGGLIASGWHTCAVGMRFAVDSYINAGVSLATPYNLFGSKRAIVLAILQDVREFHVRFSHRQVSDPLERIFTELRLCLLSSAVMVDLQIR